MNFSKKSTVQSSLKKVVLYDISRMILENNTRSTCRDLALRLALKLSIINNVTLIYIFCVSPDAYCEISSSTERTLMIVLN